MIDKLSIKRFRSHLFVEFKNCNRINLVLGRNNAGKTEILEALFLLMAPPNSRETLALLNEQRGYQPAEESPRIMGFVLP